MTTSPQNDPVLVGPVGVLEECVQPLADQFADRFDQFHGGPTRQRSSGRRPTSIDARLQTLFVMQLRVA